MTYSLSIKNNKGEWIRCNVSKDVYIYVRQLESYINNPQKSKIKQLYPERFGKDLENVSEDDSNLILV